MTVELTERYSNKYYSRGFSAGKFGDTEWGTITEKGESAVKTSGPSQSTYPADGVSGSYWYTYLGSDSIDPASVSYPSSPKSGTPIKITVNKGKGNQYGGTISYQYEVSLDGGNSWSQLGLTTALTMDYTIPKGSPSFRARVQARDNMGFTSSTWIYGPQVTVINNAAPGVPGSITVPVSPRGGAQTTITWTAASDADGNLAGYELSRQLDGGGWTTLQAANKLSFVDTIPKGSRTVAYRVRAYDADNAYGGYRTSDTRTVVNNNPPRITCALSGDLGTKDAGFVVEYSVADDEGGAVTVTEQVGELVKRSYQVTLGQTAQYQVTGEHFMRILNGSHTLKITARDADGLTDSVTLTFTKAVYAASVTLEQPLAVDKPITLAIMSVLGQIPAGHTYKVEATNNAKDPSPVWQDVTNEVKKGVNIVFQNKIQAAGPAFNFRLNVARGNSGAPGYLQAITGGFQ